MSVQVEFLPFSGGEFCKLCFCDIVSKGFLVASIIIFSSHTLTTSPSLIQSKVDNVRSSLVPPGCFCVPIVFLKDRRIKPSPYFDSPILLFFSLL